MRINRAYLDIETTGIDYRINEITVVGIYFEFGRFYQTFGDFINWDEILKLLEPVDLLYTFNGSLFDLKFIEYKTGISLEDYVIHCDLRFECKKKNLKGGLKKIENILGIKRNLPEINGYKAVLLWNDFVANGNKNSLKKLLEYNREDIFNLSILRRKIGVK